MLGQQQMASSENSCHWAKAINQQMGAITANKTCKQQQQHWRLGQHGKTACAVSNQQPCNSKNIYSERNDRLAVIVSETAVEVVTALER